MPLAWLNPPHYLYGMRKLALSAGTKFGRLTTIEEVHDPRRGQWWRCKCDCGTETIVRALALNNNNTRSCGCLFRDRLRVRNFKHGHATRGRASSEFVIWQCARDRCHNPSAKQFHNYGGRGIQMYEPWRTDFASFLEHIGPRPSPQYTLDRINNDKGYEPGNLRWATRAEQARNRTDNCWVEYDGKRMILGDAIALIGISRTAVSDFMKRNRCTAQEAIDRQVKSRLQARRNIGPLPNSSDTRKDETARSHAAESCGPVQTE